MNEKTPQEMGEEDRKIYELFTMEEIVLLRGLLIGEISRNNTYFAQQYVDLYEKINFLAGVPSPEIL